MSKTKTKNINATVLYSEINSIRMVTQYSNICAMKSILYLFDKLSVQSTHTSTDNHA
jgi:hypothetical protein